MRTPLIVAVAAIAAIAACRQTIPGVPYPGPSAVATDSALAHGIRLADGRVAWFRDWVTRYPDHRNPYLPAAADTAPTVRVVARYQIDASGMLVRGSVKVLESPSPELTAAVLRAVNDTHRAQATTVLNGMPQVVEMPYGFVVLAGQ